MVQGMRLYYWLRVFVLVRTGKTVAKIARRREMRLWVDGLESFKRIEQLINHAQGQIVIQMFIWKNDTTGRRIASLLLEAAQRGVHVDITKEAVGDFFELHHDFLGTKDAEQYPWKAFWHHPNIHIHYATNNDHAKVFIIDSHTLLLTGMNIADEYRFLWHDYMVELRDSAFVEQFLTRTPTRKIGSVQLVMNTEERKEIRPALMELLRNAQTHVVFEHCYFSDPEVIAAVIALTKRDVKVTIILPKPVDFHYHANLMTMGRLLADAKGSHLSILLNPEMFHAKAIIVDAKTAFVGSANLFKASLDEMGEVNVLIEKRHRPLWKLREAIRRNVMRSTSTNTLPAFSWFSRWLAWLGL